MGCAASTDAQNKQQDKQRKRQQRPQKNNDAASNDGSSVGPAPHPLVVDEVVSKEPNHRDLSESQLSDISDTDIENHTVTATAPTGRVGKSLDQQREESAVDLETEFFVWDDANLDLRDMRKKNMEQQKKVALTRRPDKPTGAAAFVFNDFTIDDLQFLSESRRGTAPSLLKKQDKEQSMRFIPRPAAPRNPGDIKDFSFTTRIGHSNRVKCLSIAPGEREYVSCSNDDSIVTYYDVRTAQELGIYSGHQDTVIHAVFSPCGKFLATTSRDNTLVLWDVVTQKAVLTFEHGKVVICCSFSKSSRFIATGCQDKVCRLWECRRGKELVAFAQHEGIIISLSISPDESYVCSASADKTLRIWTANKGRPKAVLKGHSHIILACNYTSDGTKIISNDERSVKIWSAPAGQCLRTINVEDMNKKKSAAPANKKMSWTLSCLAPKSFPRHFVVASNNRMVFVIDMETGEETLSVDTKAPVYCLAPGHRRLVTFGDSFGNVYFLKLEPFDADDAVDERPGGEDWA